MTPDSDIQFRAATPDDALCLGVLGLQVYLDNYAKAGIRPAIAAAVLTEFATTTLSNLLQRPNGWLWVAEQKGHLVGFAQVGLNVAQERVKATRAAELERLYVQEPFTRLGLGSALIQRAEQAAAAAGADALWLSPWVHNQRALAFYARHGYRDVGLAWYVVEEERHENRVLVKDLCSLGSLG